MRRLVRILIGVFVLFAPCTALAQSATPAIASPAGGGFTKGTIGVEFAGTVAPEIWNLNGSHEWVIDGTFSFWWNYKAGRTFIVELHAAPILQDSSRNAFVQGIMPVFRCRLRERSRSTMFMEFGAGLSWSDTRVPPRGTRYNYLTATGFGFTRQLSNQIRSVATVRWLHLSNAGWEGKDHNPDIEAIGAYLGLSIAFGPGSVQGSKGPTVQGSGRMVR